LEQKSVEKMDGYKILFLMTTVAVVPFWLVAIAWPPKPRAHRFIRSKFTALTPAAVYLLMFIVSTFGFVKSGNRPKAPIDVFSALIQSQAGLVACWAHLLVGDLLLGRWMYLEIARRPLQQRGARSVCLALSGLFGPIGYLAYLAARWLQRQREAARNS
jgi:Domain of unknown function (DUF4281)